MHTDLLKLNYLYHLEMFGEEFFEGFPQSNPSTQQGFLGFSPQQAKIGFITQTPLIDKDWQFLPTKSAQMLEDIITKVFALKPQECCIFSLFKTQQISYEQDIKQHAEILLSQITQSSAQVFVIFGLSEIANHLLPSKVDLGSLTKFKNKSWITTHSLLALIKLPALKKQTFHHLKIAKASL